MAHDVVLNKYSNRLFFSEEKICSNNELTEDVLGLNYRGSYLNANELSKIYNCEKPCKYEEYKVTRSKYVADLTKKENENITAAMYLYIYYMDNSIEEIKEYVAFDGFSLVAELGGVFGLFLGWSFYPFLVSLVIETKTRLAGKKYKCNKV